MSPNRPSLDDYVDVAERIQDFKDAHPDGSLQTLGWEVVTVDGYDRKASSTVKTTFIVYRAAAYRHSGDTAPGHGIAWEPFPGATPYTKDSELMNAETAAWGRAICALGLVSNRSLASRQEVRNRRADQDASVSDPKPSSAPPKAPPKGKATPKVSAERTGDNAPVNEAILGQLRDVFVTSGADDDQLCWMLLSVGVQSLPENPSKADIGAAMKGLTMEQAWRLEALLKGEDESVPGAGS